MKKPEVLAPVGDFERLEAAVEFGADAVYLGAKTMGMRSAPANFTWEELARAVRFAHSRGVKVYLTCNTIPLNREMDQAEAFLLEAQNAGVDGVIVADLGILMTARRVVPRLPVHISTQAGVVNYATATELFRLGARRVVLARELSLEDVKEIRARTPKELEIECFVHGAMCVSFSGRCLLSNYLTGRDGNRGECAQPCRWRYALMEEHRPGEYYPIEEDSKGTFLLNAKDLCMLPYLDQLAEAGIDSFKIEGRAKSSYYVAVVTNAYRNGVDLWAKEPGHYRPPQWLLDEMNKVSHRAYSTGFYFGPPQQGQYYETRGYVREWAVMAKVTGWEEGMLLCSQRNRFFPGDRLEALIPGAPTQEVPVTLLMDGEGNVIESARHPVMDLKIPFDHPLPPGTLLRKIKEE